MPGLDDSRQRDDVERAHLRDPRDRTFHIHRYPADPQVSGLVRRFWIPVWDVPAGERAEQKVLQYPICLAVTTPSYSRFAGPTRGLSVTVLQGRAWAFGAMFQPAAGALLLGGPVSSLTDRFLDLDEIPALRGLTAAWRALMAPDPDRPDAHRVGRDLLTERLTGLADLDEESRLVNALVEAVEGDPGLTRVSQLCRHFDLTERSLQRLTARRLGLTPLWLIRRRRLHEAAERLRAASSGTLADVAAELGFADQAHFSRDFRASTGMTPREFERLNAPRAPGDAPSGGRRRAAAGPGTNSAGRG